MAKNFKVAILNADSDVEKLDDLYIADENVKQYIYSRKLFNRALQNEACMYRMSLHSQFCILNQSNESIHTKIFTQLFIETSLIMAKYRRRYKCPSTCVEQTLMNL